MMTKLQQLVMWLFRIYPKWYGFKKQFNLDGKKYELFCYIKLYDANDEKSFIDGISIEEVYIQENKFTMLAIQPQSSLLPNVNPVFSKIDKNWER